MQYIYVVEEYFDMDRAFTPVVDNIDAVYQVVAESIKQLRELEFDIECTSETVIGEAHSGGWLATAPNGEECHLSFIRRPLEQLLPIKE